MSCWPGLLPVWPTYFHIPKQKHTGHLSPLPSSACPEAPSSPSCPSQTLRGELLRLLRFWLTDGLSMYVHVWCVAMRSLGFRCSVALWYELFFCSLPPSWVCLWLSRLYLSCLLCKIQLVCFGLFDQCANLWCFTTNIRMRGSLRLWDKATLSCNEGRAKLTYTHTHICIT